ncbi:unnamed protein product [Clonostachys chloroleuca]|uniref:Uncharacterized protein n=1 Tax=Clonostachys chloroleuca TaxID=1926264 RepID=A0AA35LPJ7_9HYPO|nr:unnamed protein product [Clonostachys chloroleuca]
MAAASRLTVGEAACTELLPLSVGANAALIVPAHSSMDRDATQLLPPPYLRTREDIAFSKLPKQEGGSWA